MKRDWLKELYPLFYPDSIAVVGASRDEEKFGSRFLKALLTVGFPGRLYPVNPSYREVSGLKAYPNLRAIPDPVDYVIIAVPATNIMEVIADCAAKKVKAVHMFTAGFRETGLAQGREMEKTILKMAREGGFHLVGPNCIGIYSARNTMPLGAIPHLAEPGGVAILSQSGGHAEHIYDEGMARGLRFSKIVSFGNALDLGATDFLEYLEQDEDTALVGAYLEGIEDGGRFLHVLRRVSSRKPVIIWKWGKTPAGATAASSHTGALTASPAVWSAALRQGGALEVESLEELTDTLLAFQGLPKLKGQGIAMAVVAGLTDGGGGASVSAADALMAQGLAVPTFLPQTQKKLREILPPVGTILHNPLDLGGRGGDVKLLKPALALALAEPQCQALLLHMRLDGLLHYLSLATVHAIADLILEARRTGKPVVVVSTTGSREAERQEIEKKLTSAGIAVYPTLDRAARALARVTGYWKHDRRRSS